MSAPLHSPARGIAWMIVTGLLFVAVQTTVKYVGDALPAAQAGFLRYILGFVFLIPMIRPMLAARLTRRQLGLFAARGAAHTVAVILWFYAMARLTLAEVTALNYLAPIFVTLGAAAFLGEHLAFRRIAAVGIAFFGALVILRPGMRELDLAHLAMLVGALFFGGSYILAKLLSGETGAPVIIGMLTLTVTIGLLPFALAVWVTPSWEQLGWMFLVAVFATAGHYTMTLAFAAAPVTVTQPVTFLQLLWAVLTGWVIFGEPLDIWVALGGTVIVAAVSFITWREHVLKRREVTPVTPATKL